MVSKCLPEDASSKQHYHPSGDCNISFSLAVWTTWEVAADPPQAQEAVP